MSRRVIRAVFAHSVLGIVLLATAACDHKSPPPEQPSQSAPDTSRNAGPVYTALYEKLDQSFLRSVGDAMSKGSGIDPQLAGALKAHKGDIDEVINATRLPECDFGKIDSTDAAMPQLFQMRSLFKLLNADAQRSLMEANPVIAAGRDAAILRMAHHMSLNGQTSIQLLIATSMAQNGLKLLNDKIDPALLPDQLRGELKEAVAALDTPDFLHAKDTLVAELTLEASALRDGKMTKDLGGTPLSPADRERAANEVEAAASQLSAAWDRPDAPSALDGLSVGKSSAAKLMLGALSKVWSSVAETKPALAAAKKKLAP